MKLKTVLVMVGVAVLSAASFGQGFRGGMMGGPGGGNPTMMLMRDDVKNDLKLTDDQKSKLQEVQDNTRQQMMDLFQGGGGPGGDREAMRKAMEPIMKKATDEINKILTADQQKRLKEIWIQVTGNMVVMNADIQKELGITAEQKTKVDVLNKRQQAANQSIMQKVRDGEIQREDLQDIFKKNQKVMGEEIDKILTQEQKDKIKALGGTTKFVADPPPGGF